MFIKWLCSNSFSGWSPARLGEGLTTGLLSRWAPMVGELERAENVKMDFTVKESELSPAINRLWYKRDINRQARCF